MPDTAAQIRTALAHPGGAWHALELALAAAKAAGEKVIRGNSHRPPAEAFALALQAADETMERIGLELADDGMTAEG